MLRPPRSAVLGIVLAACAAPATLPQAEVDVRFALAEGPYVVSAELADEPEEMQRGLMERLTLPPDTGMLFVWEDVARRTFWMKDTLIELDLIAIADGRVVSIQHMVPCEVAECPRTSTRPAEAALEVAAGTAARRGITVGTPVTWDSDGSGGPSGRGRGDRIEM